MKYTQCFETKETAIAVTVFVYMMIFSHIIKKSVYNINNNTPRCPCYKIEAS